VTPRHLISKRLAAVERALAPPFDHGAWFDRWVRRAYHLDDFTPEEIELFGRLFEREARSTGETSTWESWRALCQDDGERRTLDGLRARDEPGGERLLGFHADMHV
jgi:hypothetical protein